MSGQMSKSSLHLFGYWDGTITAANPNFAKRRSKGRRRIIKVWVLYQVKTKVKVRSNKIAKSKCWVSVVWHLIYGSFGMQNPIVTFSQKGYCQVKLGQIRSDFKIQSLLTKHAFLVQLCPTIPKISFVFMYGNYKYQKLCFIKVKSSHLPVFCPLPSQK